MIESGHPLGLFPSKEDAPRVIITNAMMVGMFDNLHDWHEAMQMGVANYGQMTAGGWMYIGPQGIVHGTFNTLLNAGRMKLGIPQDGDLSGHLFVSSGLGGMSGAQPKAADIAGAASITAEVDASRIETRKNQGWVKEVTDSIPRAFELAEKAMAEKKPLSIAYHGNVVDLLEYAVEHDKKIELLSDQTSCHAVYEGGYCPAGLSFEERTKLLHEDHDAFRKKVDESLKRHFEAIKALTSRGTYFFDYGNSFMKAIYDAGVKEISRNGIDEKDGFIWPSYVEDIMGPMLFDYGYGPFRWVCLSGKHEDLVKTDRAAMECIDPDRRGQDRDNYNWIRDAEKKRSGSRHTGKNFVSGRHGSSQDCPSLQRDGPQRRSRAYHAWARPPRRKRHRLSFPRDIQHKRRIKCHGRHGCAMFCRQLRTRNEPRGAAQRRRSRYRQINKRWFRHGLRRL